MPQKFSEDQIAALVQEITTTVLNLASTDQEGSDKAEEEIPETGDRKRRRGRQRSPYTGQLHLKILPEDEEWFKSMRDSLEVKNGKLFHMLRQHFDDSAVTTGGKLDRVNRS